MAILEFKKSWNAFKYQHPAALLKTVLFHWKF